MSHTTAMKVAMTSTSYPANSSDWKGLFIQRMVEGLCRSPTIQLEFWGPLGPLPPNAASALQSNDENWLKRLAAEGGIAHLLRKRPLRGLFKSFVLLARERRALESSSCEIFHINWMQNALALPKDSRAAVITALGTDMQLLRFPFVTYFLRRKLKGRRVAICPNAEWMLPKLQRSFGHVAEIIYVPFGIDDAWYEVKRAPQTAPHRWICVSRITRGKLGPLFEWAEPHFKNGGRELHLIGPKQDFDIDIPDWVHFHGSATPAELQVNWFPEVAGLISLSSHPEGRPQVMLEAMASGVPILASRLPAHEDLIGSGTFGHICDDVDSFAHGLKKIEHPEHNRVMGDMARQYAMRHFGTWGDCAERLRSIYFSLSNRHSI